MWYFSWILGTGLACAFAILNAVWLELREGDNKEIIVEADVIK
ncbi:cytochrome bd-I oxidase subunit CydX [Legionella maioricensis]|uniref:Cytochrome bd-I oxidase subunit CydX n=1 Tax=Legionella maioricensis TaxID=2896528 RepID=A0A9X2ICG2_9GAMM|nr:cytochrome bd-I oxidase subunit CydX [Legionella maioricensis]MCL9685400.1 cytochrome bd-I oxidase subunit CydX [Legionella maioricensis]MCL9688641.1 cytochrome bd-I oxidase subunit CydX [Legionella maioricensis]